jgi:peptidoglycan/xylan/chitin deacetylase (PgdA/CDA1 family)
MERLTKLFISIGFFLYTEAENVLRSLMGRKPPATCVVLYYHEVGLQDRARFARQMDALILHSTPIPADTHEPLVPGQNYVVVTFDDAFLSTVENAIPELVQRKIPATLFAVAGLLGANPQWATFGGDSLGNERIAPLERLRELPPDLITIGSHTMSHPLLPSVSEREAMVELSESRAELKRLLNREIKLFSFPYGASNEHLIDLCREAGYERVFTILPLLAFTAPQEFVTGRVAVNPTDWQLEFRLKLLGAYRWLPKAMLWKRKFLRRNVHERLLVPVK